MLIFPQPFLELLRQLVVTKLAPRVNHSETIQRFETHSAVKNPFNC